MWTHVLEGYFQLIILRVFIQNYVFSQFTATYPLNVELKKENHPSKRSEYTVTLIG